MAGTACRGMELEVRLVAVWQDRRGEARSVTVCRGEVRRGQAGKVLLKIERRVYGYSLFMEDAIHEG